MTNLQIPPALEPSKRASLYRRIAAFFALSYVLSWWLYPVAWLTGSHGLAMNFPLGPLIAVVVFIAATEGKLGLRDWWRRITHFRAPLRFYIIAALVPAAISLASAGAALALGSEAPPTKLWLDNILPSLAIIIPMAILFGPMGEELAFRGWGQYRLQTAVSPFAAALLIGVGVIGWHLPIFATGDIPWTVVFALPAVSVAYAWLYRMSGSIWTAVTLHTFHNVVSGEYVGTVFDGRDADLRLAVVAVLYIVWAAFIVYRYGPSLVGRESSDSKYAEPTKVLQPTASEA